MDHAIEPKKNQYIVNSIRKAFSVLNVMLLESGIEPLSVADIARKAGVDKSACHRILVTLMEDGIISQTKSGSYKIGVGLLRMGQMSFDKVPTIGVANDLLDDLTTRTGESSYLFVENGGERACVAKADSPQIIRHFIKYGASLPLYAGAAGKVLLAAYSEQQLDEYLDGHTLEKLGLEVITEPARLKEELSKIRRMGIAWSRRERSDDSASVAAPVRNEKGAVVACISVAGPDERIKSRSDSYWEDLIKDTCMKLSTAMNFQPGKVEEKWTLEHMV